MEKIKPEEIVNVYRKLLDPMGYNVVPKLTSKELEANIWAPPESEEIYLKMSSIELEKKIQDLKVQQSNMAKELGNIKEKVIVEMNKIAKNEVTDSLYTGMYAANAINKNAIRIESHTADYLSKMIGYLQNRKKEMLIRETLDILRKEVKTITSVEVVKLLGGTELKVMVK
jgi:hypothetical protein